MTAVFLDVSRTLSRLDRSIKTGIDRVEWAYIDRLARHENSWAIGRFGKEYLIAPMEDFASISASNISNQQIGLLDLFRRKLTAGQRKTKTCLRKRFGLLPRSKFLGKIHRLQLDKARLYHVGHSRALLSDFEDLKSFGIKTFFLIHDFIPLTHPEFVRPDTVPKFKDFISKVDALGDQINFVSQTTYDQAANYLANPNLGQVLFSGLASNLNFDGETSDAGFILMVGTIEPRKNIDLILNIWGDRNYAELPPLIIVGQKGWIDDAKFEQLKSLEAKGRLKIMQSVDDLELSELFAKASAIIFPSFVEGYGLPVIEAAAFEKAILASDIPAFREILGPDAILLDPLDPEEWRKAIQNPSPFLQNPDIRTWDTHFERLGL